MIFIFSMARSGSTWFGKIFDSHPDILYLHEPDVDDRGLDLFPSYWFANGPDDRDLEKARLYVDRLAGNRSLHATGTRPFFRKNYRGTASRTARTAIILLGKGLERFSPIALDIRVPDLAASAAEPGRVIKSVSGMGLAERFVKAREDLYPILLIRHPCGYVASMLRGRQLGLQQLPDSLGGLLDTRAAAEMRLSKAALSSLDVVELLAWTWLLQNMEARRAVLPRGRVIRYDDYAADPVESTRALFRQLQLSWTDQTERFLTQAASRDGSYYATFRRPSAIDGWRRELDTAAVSCIRGIVTKSELGHCFFTNTR